jgi:hypothetical protein
MERAASSRPGSVVVPLLGYGACLGRQRDSRSTAWGNGAAPRFWLVRWRDRPALTVDGFQAELVKRAPKGSVCLAAFPHEDEEDFVAGAAAIVDTGPVMGAALLCGSQFKGICGPVTVKAFFWEPTECWARGGQCGPSCDGEVLFALQEQMLCRGGDAGSSRFSGRALLEREFDCIRVSSSG